MDRKLYFNNRNVQQGGGRYFLFGYVKPNKKMLGEENTLIYKSMYCALCDGLSLAYGMISRLFVSYDITFAMFCLDGFRNNQVCHNVRCPLYPFKKLSIFVSDDTVSFASLVSYFMFREKLRDNISDSRNVIVRFFYKALFCASGLNLRFRKQSKHYSKLLLQLTFEMDKLYEMEKCPDEHSLDELLDKSGLFIRHLAEEFFDHFMVDIPDDQAHAVAMLFYNIGKWIYFVDAFDDYKNDMRKGKFNLLSMVKSTDEEDGEFQTGFLDDVILMNRILISKINYYAVTADVIANNNIVMNIVKYGLDTIFNSVLCKKFIWMRGK